MDTMELDNTVFERTLSPNNDSNYRIAPPNHLVDLLEAETGDTLYLQKIKLDNGENGIIITSFDPRSQ